MSTLLPFKDFVEDMSPAEPQPPPKHGIFENGSDPMEQARALKRRQVEEGLNVTALAIAEGTNTSRISIFLRLLELPEDKQKMVADKKIHWREAYDRWLPRTRQKPTKAGAKKKRKPSMKSKMAKIAEDELEKEVQRRIKKAVEENADIQGLVDKMVGRLVGREL